MGEFQDTGGLQYHLDVVGGENSQKAMQAFANDLKALRAELQSVKDLSASFKFSKQSAQNAVALSTALDKSAKAAHNLNTEVENTVDLTKQQAYLQRQIQNLKNKSYSLHDKEYQRLKLRVDQESRSLALESKRLQLGNRALQEQERSVAILSKKQQLTNQIASSSDTGLQKLKLENAALQQQQSLKQALVLAGSRVLQGLKTQVALQTRLSSLKTTLTVGGSPDVQGLQKQVALMQRRQALETSRDVLHDRDYQTIKKKYDLEARLVSLESKKFQLENLTLQKKERVISILKAQRAIETTIAELKDKNLQRLSVEEQAQKRITNLLNQQVLARRTKTLATKAGLDINDPNVARQLGLEVQENAKTMSQASESTRSYAVNLAHLFKVYAFYTIINQFTRALRTVITELFRFNAEMEVTELGLAALFTATGTLVDENGRLLKGVEALNAAHAVSRDQMRKLRVDALSTSSTFEDLARNLQYAIAPGMKAGFDPDQVREFTGSVSRAATAVGLLQNQLPEEIRSLLTGQIRQQTSRLAVSLDISREDVKNWTAMGTLFKELQSRFQAFNDAGEESMETLTVKLSNLKDRFQLLAGAAGIGVFEDFKDLVTDLSNALVTKDPFGKMQPSKSALAALTAFADEIKLLLQYVRRLAVGGNLEDLAASLGKSLRVLVVYALEIVKTFVTIFGWVSKLVTAFDKLEIFGTRSSTLAAGLGKLTAAVVGLATAWRLLGVAGATGAISQFATGAAGKAGLVGAGAGVGAGGGLTAGAAIVWMKSVLLTGAAISVITLVVVKALQMISNKLASMGGEGGQLNFTEFLSALRVLFEGAAQVLAAPLFAFGGYFLGQFKSILDSMLKAFHFTGILTEADAKAIKTLEQTKEDLNAVWKAIGKETSDKLVGITQKADKRAGIGVDDGTVESLKLIDTFLDSVAASVISTNYNLADMTSYLEEAKKEAGEFKFDSGDYGTSVSGLAAVILKDVQAASFAREEYANLKKTLQDQQAAFKASADARKEEAKSTKLFTAGEIHAVAAFKAASLEVLDLKRSERQLVNEIKALEMAGDASSLRDAKARLEVIKEGLGLAKGRQAATLSGLNTESKGKVTTQVGGIIKAESGAKATGAQITSLDKVYAEQLALIKVQAQKNAEKNYLTARIAQEKKFALDVVQFKVDSGKLSEKKAAKERATINRQYLAQESDIERSALLTLHTQALANLKEEEAVRKRILSDQLSKAATPEDKTKVTDAQAALDTEIANRRKVIDINIGGLRDEHKIRTQMEEDSLDIKRKGTVNYFTEMGDGFSELQTTVAGTLSQAFTRSVAGLDYDLRTALGNALLSFADKLGQKVFEETLDGIVSALTEGAKSEAVMGPLSKIFSGIFGTKTAEKQTSVVSGEGIVGGATETTDMMTSKSPGMLGTITGGFKKMLGSLTGVLSGGFSGLLGSIGGLFSGGFGGLMSSMSGLLSGGFEGIMGSLSSLFSGMGGGGGGGGVGAAIGGLASMAMSFFGGAAHGGLVRGYASGGPVPGRPAGIDRRDTVPAWLRPSEYVIRPEAVSKYGASLFQAMNNLQLDSSSLPGVSTVVESVPMVRGMASAASGGSVGYGSGPMSQILPVLVANELSMERMIAGGRSSFDAAVSKASNQNPNQTRAGGGF